MTALNKGLARLTAGALQSIARGTFKAQGKGKLHDGGGLYLTLNEDRGGRWIFRGQRDGKEIVRGLGSLDVVGAAEAREKARELRESLRKGQPVPGERAERKARAERQTFRSEAALVLAAVTASGKHAKTVEKWTRALNRANAAFGDVALDDIQTPQVAELIVPIMKRTYQTGMHTRECIQFVFKHAEGYGRFDRERSNPATAEKISAAVHYIKRPRVKHHNTMPFEHVPDLMAKLASMETTRAYALMMTILSGLRTSEVVKARWSEFDLKDRVWSVPDEHMKMRKAHFVPISSGIDRILTTMRHQRRNDRVFPDRGSKRLDHLCEGSMLDVLQKVLGLRQFTVHGMRSSIRNWGGKRFPNDVMERVLAHEKGGTEGSYHTDQFFEERREVMEAWSAFVMPGRVGAHLALAR